MRHIHVREFPPPRYLVMCAAYSLPCYDTHTSVYSCDYRERRSHLLLTKLYAIVCHCNLAVAHSCGAVTFLATSDREFISQDGMLSVTTMRDEGHLAVRDARHPGK